MLLRLNVDVDVNGNGIEIRPVRTTPPKTLLTLTATGDTVNAFVQLLDRSRNKTDGNNTRGIIIADDNRLENAELDLMVVPCLYYDHFVG